MRGEREVGSGGLRAALLQREGVGLRGCMSLAYLKLCRAENISSGCTFASSPNHLSIFVHSSSAFSFALLIASNSIFA